MQTFGNTRFFVHRQLYQRIIMDKNLTLIESIKKYPCIYNHTMSEYSHREITEQAWHDISAETSLLVPECKEKWKNLRHCFIRSLKNNPERSTRKRYYLHKELEFIIPFIKPTKPIQNIVYEDEPTDDDSNPAERLKSALNINDDESTTKSENIDYAAATSEPQRKRAKNVGSIINYIDPYCQPIESPGTYDDSRKMFLLSILPEVNQLSEDQMKLFRRKVLVLLDDITYESWHTERVGALTHDKQGPNDPLLETKPYRISL